MVNYQDVAYRALDEYRHIKQRIIDLQDRLAEYEDIDAGGGVQRAMVETELGPEYMTIERVSSSNVGDPTGNLAVKIAETKTEIHKAISLMVEKLNDICELIDQVADDRERRVLYLRHVRCFKWDRIMREMHYEHSQIHNIHARALESVGKILTVDRIGHCD